MTTLATTAAATPAAARLHTRLLASRVPLALFFAAATVLGCLQSIGHRTPLVFSDELLYSQFSQGIAEGHGFSIWGVHQLFPSPLLPLVQAPVWLFGTVGESYGAARVLNTLLMAAAVFPAYWLARRLVRHEWALVAAAAAVTIPEMGYHDFLMAEPLAYPLFLLAAGAIIRAVADGGRWMRVLAVGACILAAGARLQLAALVLAYAAAVLVASPRRRAHLVPFAVLCIPPAAALAWRGPAVALGQYNGFLHLHAGPTAVVHWIALLLVLLPFSFGLATAPGALLGLAARPRNRAELAFAVFTVAIGAVLLVQAGMIAAGDAQRPLTRYVFYLAPLLVVSFLLYVERGAPRRLLYVALALAGGLAASRLPFSQLTPTGLFDSETPATTAFATLQKDLGGPRGTLVVELGVLVIALLVAALPLRRPSAVLTTAVVGMAAALALGSIYVHADHRVTRVVTERYAPSDLDWIDATGFRHVTYLPLPLNEVVPDSEVEFWNRSIDRVAQFSTTANGALPLQRAGVSSDGRLLVGGAPASAGVYVVGRWGSRIGLDGEVLGRSSWLTALRLDRGARVRWLATGLDRDGYSGRFLTYRTWVRGGVHAGRFSVRISLPAGSSSKTVTLRAPGTQRQLVLRAGTQRRLVVSVPASHRPGFTMAVVGSRTTLSERGVHIDRVGYRRLP